jgi:hypothetical protein
VRVRYASRPEVEGTSSRFNTAGVGEVIVYWSLGDMDSEEISKLEVLLGGDWKDMTQAFRDHDLVTDAINTCFMEPPTPADRERGYVL